MSKPLRVFQVASGNVGTEMIKRITRHHDLELIGLHCYSADKLGRDAGELAGIGPIGVAATGMIDEIIAARPDCLTFHGVWPDLMLYERVLEAGINIVTTADWAPGITATPTTAYRMAARNPKCCSRLACEGIRPSTGRG